jgi:hypothetical protein
LKSPRTSRHLAGPAFAALALLCSASGPLAAQVVLTPPAKQPSSAPRTAAKQTPILRAAHSGTPTAGAWALPDPDQLIERVFTRIVNQDKPNAIPVRDYSQRLFGREETLAALRQFAGHSIDLRPTAFTAVSGFDDLRRADYKPCIGVGCEAPVNSLWLAVTRIERGELPHELHVWYTTSFASEGPTGAARQTYSFCERWLRVNGTWKYDGFVRVNAG